ncbi:MAG: ABC transporter ATP-binding protein [Propionicimonas sp.]
MTVAQLEDVSIIRSGVTLLSAITLSIAENQRWVILGANGAGKTTLLQVLAAQIHPSRGRATLLGERLGAVDVFELRPRIGVSSAALADHLPKGESVADVVISAAYGVTGRWREHYAETDRRRAQQLMWQLRVEHLADRTFGTLSEGERKRVQIARALMTDPEMLLLDEPAAGLDLSGREALVGTLGEICLNPTAPTTVLVTHHLEEIPLGITHALLLKQGRMVAAGPLARTLSSELVSYTFDLPLEISTIDGRWSARTTYRPRFA